MDKQSFKSRPSDRNRAQSLRKQKSQMSEFLTPPVSWKSKATPTQGGPLGFPRYTQFMSPVKVLTTLREKEDTPLQGLHDNVHDFPVPSLAFQPPALLQCAREVVDKKEI